MGAYYLSWGDEVDADDKRTGRWMASLSWQEPAFEDRPRDRRSTWRRRGKSGPIVTLLEFPDPKFDHDGKARRRLIAAMVEHRTGQPAADELVDLVNAHPRGLRYTTAELDRVLARGVQRSLL